MIILALRLLGRFDNIVAVALVPDWHSCIASDSAIGTNALVDCTFFIHIQPDMQLYIAGTMDYRFATHVHPAPYPWPLHCKL